MAGGRGTDGSRGRRVIARAPPRRANAVRACAEAGVEYLTLFAFSSENWARPTDEVKQLLALFERVLVRESDELAENGVKIRFIGDRGAFPRPSARPWTSSSAGRPGTVASTW